MNKCAIFVEGLTELEFTVELIKCLAGDKNYRIQTDKQFRGKIGVSLSHISSNADYFYLVVDCATDGQVKTQINDRYHGLVSAGFTHIIGLRDVYPLTHADIPALEAHLYENLPLVPVHPSMHLAVLETESWFLHDHSHFKRIHPRLEPSFIESNGYLITKVSADSWPKPAQTLDQIYRLARACWVSKGKKSGRRITRTIQALSYENLYCERSSVPALDEFIGAVEKSLW